MPDMQKTTAPMDGSTAGPMMPQDFLATLAERRVSLSVEDGKLKFRAPEGAVDERLRVMLRRFKDDLIKALKPHGGAQILCPLSYNQQSLFFLSLLEPRSAAYNLAFSIRLRPAADARTLHRALERLVRRHGQLRTTYGHLSLGDTMAPAQFVHEMLTPLFETIDARSWTETELSEGLKTFYQRSFDLQQGPVVRAGLFDRGQDGTIFMVAVHHIAADAWSMRLIRRDLEQACLKDLESDGNAMSKNEYIDFAIAQRRAFDEPAGRERLQYWGTLHASPAPPVDIGGEARRPPVRRSVGATHHFRIDPSLRLAVETAAREQGITSFALLLSVFQWLLFEHSGKRDVVIGIPTLGRNDQRFENTVGYFVNPIPLRCTRTVPLTFREHAQATARELREALEHRDAPFAAIVEHLGCARDAARTTVFQVMFNFLSRKTLDDAIDLLYPVDGAPAVDFAGLKATACSLDQQEGQFDLTLEFVDYGDQLLGLLKYCTDLVSSTEAAELATTYRARLDAVLSAPDTVLLQADREQGKLASESEVEVVAVAATFTAEVLQEFYEFWFKRLKWNASIRFAPFNQVFQELLDPSGVLRTNRRGHNIVLVRLEDFIAGRNEDTRSGSDGKNPGMPQILEELRSAVATASRSMAVPLCFVLCPPSPVGEELQRRHAGEMEQFLESLRSLPGVTVLTPSEISRYYPVTQYHESLGEAIGRIPYTRPYLAAIATTVVRSLRAVSRPPVKALVLDCDGTLWDGVVGEDGPVGVMIGPLQRKFQEFLLDQHRAGVILCLCSKNQAADVWSVFDQHPGMLLRREHIGFWKINWEPKSVNIRALRDEMNFGFDAIAFLDDNPVECAEVRLHCPPVLCLDLPKRWEDRMSWLEHIWILDHVRRTAEDGKRQEHYRSEQLRDDLKQHTASFREFLDKLELRIDLSSADAADYDRLAQLSLRTNQFTTTVLRLSLKEIEQYASAQGRSAHSVRVSDRFGDYGLVGGMLTRIDAGILHVDGFFLSCRALGRGVEHRMAAHLGAIARQEDCSTVAFPVRVTDRNEPARNFLERLGRFSGSAGDDNGVLKIEAEQLAAVRYETLLDRTEDAAPADPPSSAPQTVTAAPSGERDIFLQIAGELRTIDAIVTAVDRMLHERPGRMGTRVAAGPVVAPATRTEQVIADVWKRVLGVNDVSMQSNFFEVGGTSLLMARIAIELGRDHGLDVSLMDLFQYPAIRDLARHLDGRGPDTDASAQAVIKAARQREALHTHLPAAFQRLKGARG